MLKFVLAVYLLLIVMYRSVLGKYNLSNVQSTP